MLKCSVAQNEVKHRKGINELAFQQQSPVVTGLTEETAQNYLK